MTFQKLPFHVGAYQSARSVSQSYSTIRFNFLHKFFAEMIVKKISSSYKWLVIYALLTMFVFSGIHCKTTASKAANVTTLAPANSTTSPKKTSGNATTAIKGTTLKTSATTTLAPTPPPATTTVQPSSPTSTEPTTILTTTNATSPTTSPVTSSVTSTQGTSTEPPATTTQARQVQPNPTPQPARKTTTTNTSLPNKMAKPVSAECKDNRSFSFNKTSTDSTQKLLKDLCADLQKGLVTMNLEYASAHELHLLIMIGDFVGLLLVLLVWCIFWIRKKIQQKKDAKKKRTPAKPMFLSPAPLRPAESPAAVPLFEEENKIIEFNVPSPPSIVVSNEMKKELMEQHANLQKLRAHVKKTTAQHKSDVRTSKFVKKGPIYIPNKPDVPPPATDLPDNVELPDLQYDPKNNEIYDIGSDVDDIELEPSTSSMGTVSVEDEATRKDRTKGTPSKPKKATEPKSSVSKGE